MSDKSSYSNEVALSGFTGFTTLPSKHDALASSTSYAGPERITEFTVLPFLTWATSAGNKRDEIKIGKTLHKVSSLTKIKHTLQARSSALYFQDFSFFYLCVSVCVCVVV